MALANGVSQPLCLSLLSSRLTPHAHVHTLLLPQSANMRAQEWCAVEFSASRLLARSFTAWLRFYVPYARSKRLVRLQHDVVIELVTARSCMRVLHAASEAWHGQASKAAACRRQAVCLLQRAAIRAWLHVWRQEAHSVRTLKRKAVHAWSQGMWLHQVRRLKFDAAGILAAKAMMRRAFLEWRAVARRGLACRAVQQRQAHMMLSRCLAAWCAEAVRSEQLRACEEAVAAAAQDRRLRGVVTSWRWRAARRCRRRRGLHAAEAFHRDR